jgi:stage V sporulation protein R
MVINTDPCYAYLMEGNMMMDQKLVMAHVYGHCDFFKNNVWFGKTNRKMMDRWPIMPPAFVGIWIVMVMM